MSTETTGDDQEAQRVLSRSFPTHFKDNGDLDLDAMRVSAEYAKEAAYAGT